VTIDAQLNVLLQAFGADSTSLRAFLDANLTPETKYHLQSRRFTKAVDAALEAQNSLADWASGHISMSKADQDPHYAAKRLEVSAKREEFASALQSLLEAFRESEGQNAKR
jgi:hypothetical protein